jgi:hypothetical protein
MRRPDRNAVLNTAYFLTGGISRLLLVWYEVGCFLIYCELNPDIESGKLGSAFEPRPSMIVKPSDREAFPSVLRMHAPQAEFSL